METKKLTFRNLFSFVLITAIYSLLPLLVVGREDWVPGWVYAGLTLASTFGSRVLAARKNPGILAERANSLTAAGVKEWDKKLVPLVGMFGPLLVLLISGMDARFVWSPALPGWVGPASLAILCLGLIFGSWAFLENKFFSGTVRIQTERGHHVIDSGPYRLVRHPGYAGALWMYLAIPPYFGSLWGLIPVLGLIAAFILRTALEDKTLQEELPGYKEYTQKTRYRLFPGIW